MLDIHSVMGCGLTFDKLLRAELRGCVGGGGLRAKMWKMCGGCGLIAGQVTAGRAAGSDFYFNQINNQR